MTIKQKDPGVSDMLSQVDLPDLASVGDTLQRDNHLDLRSVLGDVLPRLQTELHAILGFSQSVEVGGSNADDRIKDIQRCAQKLISFAEQSAHLMRIETGGCDFSIQSCSIRSLLDQIDSHGRLGAVEKGLEFKIMNQTSCPDSIQTAPEQLRLSLMNLVDNAIKYTDQGYVHVMVSNRLVQEEKRLSFEFRDSGQGISRARFGSLFEPFWQVDQDLFQSLGLGLVLSRRIVEALGGSLGVSSEPQKGSTFTIEIPIESRGSISNPRQERISSIEIIRELTLRNRRP